MKKTYNIMIVLLVVLTLFLTGCGTKTTDVSTTTTTNANQDVTSTVAETSDNDNTQEVSTEETSGNIETTEPVTITEPFTTVPTQTVRETTTITTTPATTIPTTETPSSNTLKIKGKVTYEMVVTLDELKSLDDIIVEEDFSSKNNFGTAEQTNFKGVNLWYLLKNYAGIDAGASSVTVIAIDGYIMKFTIDQVMKQDYINESEPEKKLPIIIAWEENGIEYDPKVGPPYQLVVGQIGPGDFNKFQWVRNIDSIIVE